MSDAKIAETGIDNRGTELKVFTPHNPSLPIQESHRDETTSDLTRDYAVSSSPESQQGGPGVLVSAQQCYRDLTTTLSPDNLTGH